jgi:serine/threonine protein kinase
VISIPGYRIDGQLGKGGQAKVYLATDQAAGRQVAIKVLLEDFANDEDFARRFLREAETVSDLDHPNVVAVHDFGQADDTYFMVMEYLSGGDLKTKIRSGLSQARILKITAQLAEALHYAHDKGYVHRDVKPENVMFREDGTAVLTDFGIARLQSGANQMTMVGQILGTPRFMSPEQLQDRKLDGRSDIYSLGILFHLMLTGEVPYDHQDFMALAMMHCKEPVPLLPEELKKYQSIFERMVAKEPEKRFSNGAEISRILRQVLAGKLNPADVDSIAAAQYKKAAHFQARDLDAPGKTRKMPLPWDAAVALQDLDPVLDRDWQTRAIRILKSLDGETRRYVIDHHLQRKGIVVDGRTRKLVFTGRPGVSKVKHTLQSAKLKQLAAKFEAAEELLLTTRNAASFADIMESALGRLDKFETQDDLSAQKEKMVLRQAFLDDLAMIIRGAKFQIPANHRGLTEQAVKTFFIEVFLKQQMHGFRFKLYPVSSLEQSGNTFLRSVVAREVRIRQCELVRTQRYLFVIAPVDNKESNPYSARRFMHEEPAMGGRVVYFNVVVVPFASLDNEKICKHLAWSLTRVVTLERKLSAGLPELIREIEDIRARELLPLLRKGLASDGSRIEDAITRTLTACVELLNTRIAASLPKALTRIARTEDDFEYLYATWRNLIIQLGCDIRDFTSQFAVTFSDTAEELDWKVMSYLALLDKRKESLFKPGGANNRDPLKDPGNLIRDLFGVLDQFEPELKRLDQKLRDIVSRDRDSTGSFIAIWGRILGLDRKRDTPETVEREMSAVRKQALIEIIRACKRYGEIMVFLEFEGVIDIDDSARHYALPAGPLGVGELPWIICLDEDPDQLDITSLRQALNAVQPAQRPRASSAA